MSFEMRGRQRWWTLGALLLAGISFLSLCYVITYLWPDQDHVFARPHLLLFAFMFLGAGSSVIPISIYLNHRFAKPDWLERDKTRLLRQGTWVGAFLVLVAYLQLTKTFNFTIAAVLAGVFILIETFFLTRE